VQDFEALVSRQQQEATERMGYELQVTEPLHAGLRRIGRELLDDSVRLLRDGEPEDIDKNVHSARKNMKKMRGLLRLIRGSIREKDFRKDNAFFRDLSRRLAGARASHVMLVTLDKLLETEAGELQASSVTGLRDHLDENYRSQAGGLWADSDLLAEIIEALERAHKRIDRWELDRKPHKIIKAGLYAVYLRGYDELEEAREHPTSENLHEWRKRVKYLWYQLRILRPMWPHGVDPMIAALDELGEVLGQEHDHAELKALIYQLPDVFDGTDDMMALVYAIDAERSLLQARAWELGRRIYAESPKAFVARHRTYWRVWQAERQQDA
jgi:CHAD domain-containing protein